MNDLPLIKTEEVKIKGFDKVERTFLLSKIPATTSMEIVVQYSKGLLPGDSFKLTEAMAFKIMNYVAVPNPVKDKPPLRLSTEELINNHCDFHTYAKLQRAMAQYNWGFFLSDDLSDFWLRFRDMLRVSFTRIITDSLRQSSQPEKPPLQN